MGVRYYDGPGAPKARVWKNRHGIIFRWNAEYPFTVPGYAGVIIESQVFTTHAASLGWVLRNLAKVDDADRNRLLADHPRYGLEREDMRTRA